MALNYVLYDNVWILKEKNVSIEKPKTQTFCILSQMHIRFPQIKPIGKWSSQTVLQFLIYLRMFLQKNVFHPHALFCYIAIWFISFDPLIFKVHHFEIPWHNLFRFAGKNFSIFHCHVYIEKKLKRRRIVWLARWMWMGTFLAKEDTGSEGKDCIIELQGGISFLKLDAEHLEMANYLLKM